jgi:Na+(H+)/acetate symporter ActP
MSSARRSLSATMLALQAVVLGLTTPVMIAVAGIPASIALPIGLGLMLACIVVAGMLGRPWAYHLGWLIQVASVALGVVTSFMFLLGAVFLALWAGAFFLGAKIDRERAEREVLEREWAAKHGDPEADR